MKEKKMDQSHIRKEFYDAGLTRHIANVLLYHNISSLEQLKKLIHKNHSYIESLNGIGETSFKLIKQKLVLDKRSYIDYN